MPVNPVALGGITRPPKELQDLTTGGLVTVDLGRVVEPTDKDGARDRVGLQGPNRTAVVAVDGVTHWVVVVVASVRGLGSGGKVSQELFHLLCIDGGIVPCHTVTSGAQVATDLAVHHATLELGPGSVVGATVLNTCLSGVVQELIVANPEGGVPGFVGCVAVHWSSVVDVASIGPLGVSRGR